MSVDGKDTYIENRIEIFEDLLRISMEEFDKADLIGKFKILVKAPGTNAKAALKIYLEIEELCK